MSAGHYSAQPQPPTANDAPRCPYCRQAMRWVPVRGLTRGTFECERCGDFPDYQGAFEDVASREGPP